MSLPESVISQAVLKDCALGWYAVVDTSGSLLKSSRVDGQLFADDITPRWQLYCLYNNKMFKLKGFMKTLIQIYLADYGLSYRYCPNGNHKKYQENPRKGHNGTIEFTSLDAHKGVGEIAQFLACAHSLAYDEKPNYQMLRKILNPGGIPLGPLKFSAKGHSVNMHPPHNQKVDAQKATAKQINPMQYRLMEIKGHSERSTESYGTWREVQREEKLVGLLNNETAQENTRRRKIYHDPQEFFNEAKSSPQKSSCVQLPNSFYEYHQDFTSPDIVNKSESPSWYTNDTSTISMSVTDLESCRGLWPTISQFTLSKETKADVYCYSLIIFFLLMLVFLALYFL